jgi:hypothetical protein
VKRNKESQKNCSWFGNYYQTKSNCFEDNATNKKFDEDATITKKIISNVSEQE